MDAGMVCMINEEIFFKFKYNTWIRFLGASSHITNGDSDFCGTTNINKLVQSSSGSMPTMKKRKLHMKVQQVDGSKICTHDGL